MGKVFHDYMPLFGRFSGRFDSDGLCRPGSCHRSRVAIGTRNAVLSLRAQTGDKGTICTQEWHKLDVDTGDRT
jgi:hypothetical protein